MRRLPPPYCSAPLPPGRPPGPARARARARIHSDPPEHRRGGVAVLPLLTGGAAVGAAATAWTGGSLAVRVAATLAAALAAGSLAFRRRAVTGPPGGGPGALRTAAYRVAAALVVLLVLPLLLAVALAVELTSRGPVLLRRARAGSGPTLAFRCTDQRGRTTPLGGVLRRSALEDLPALLDVVAGRVVLPGAPLIRTSRRR